MKKPGTMSHGLLQKEKELLFRSLKKGEAKKGPGLRSDEFCLFILSLSSNLWGQYRCRRLDDRHIYLLR